eukprot:324717_1
MVSTLLDFPIDLIIHILQFLSTFELFKFQKLNHTTNAIAQQPNTVTELLLDIEPLDPSHSPDNWKFFNSPRFRTSKHLIINRGGLSFTLFDYWLSDVLPSFSKVTLLHINNFDDDDHYNISFITLIRTFPNTKLIQKLYFRNIYLPDAIPFIAKCFNLIELGIHIIDPEVQIDSQITTFIDTISHSNDNYKLQRPFSNLKLLIIDQSCISSAGMQIFIYWILAQSQMVLEIYENDCVFLGLLNKSVMDQFFNLCCSDNKQQTAMQNLKCIKTFETNDNEEIEYFKNIKSMLKQQKLQLLNQMFALLTSGTNLTALLKIISSYME